MNRRVISKVAGGFSALLAVALLGACSEQPQVAIYEQGKYQGKEDARPWEGSPFNGDKAAWEKSLQARAQGQNEYKRVE
jgi:hypothetical protein